MTKAGIALLLQCERAIQRMSNCGQKKASDHTPNQLEASKETRPCFVLRRLNAAQAGLSEQVRHVVFALAGD